MSKRRHSHNVKETLSLAYQRHERLVQDRQQREHMDWCWGQVRHAMLLLQRIEPRDVALEIGKLVVHLRFYRTLYTGEENRPDRRDITLCLALGISALERVLLETLRPGDPEACMTRLRCAIWTKMGESRIQSTPRYNLTRPVDLQRCLYDSSQAGASIWLTCVIGWHD